MLCVFKETERRGGRELIREGTRDRGKRWDIGTAGQRDSARASDSVP